MEGSGDEITSGQNQRRRMGEVEQNIPFNGRNLARTCKYPL